jgi:hypothetical protein
VRDELGQVIANKSANENRGPLTEYVVLQNVPFAAGEEHPQWKISHILGSWDYNRHPVGQEESQKQ